MEKFIKSLKDLDLVDLSNKFDLDVIGQLKVDINGKERLINLRAELNVYRLFCRGEVLYLQRRSRKSIITQYRKWCRKKFGKNIRYSKCEIYDPKTNEWYPHELYRPIQRVKDS
jgi:hypothetical protein